MEQVGTPQITQGKVALHIGPLGHISLAHFTLLFRYSGDASHMVYQSTFQVTQHVIGANMGKGPPGICHLPATSIAPAIFVLGTMIYRSSPPFARLVFGVADFDPLFVVVVSTTRGIYIMTIRNQKEERETLRACASLPIRHERQRSPWMACLYG